MNSLLRMLHPLMRLQNPEKDGIVPGMPISWGLVPSRHTGIYPRPHTFSYLPSGSVWRLAAWRLWGKDHW